MLSVGTKKRIARIARRAIPEVLEAYQQGAISARRADTLLYLPPAQQRAELDRILAAQQNGAERSRIAAEVIRHHVDAGRRDLAVFREDLKMALSSSALQ